MAAGDSPPAMHQTSLFEEPQPASPAPAPERAAGLARLEAFLPRAGIAYAKGRGTDDGPDPRKGGARRNVSCLSPYLRRRLLTEEETARAAHARHGKAAEKFVAEIFWRTYFKGWLERRPWVWEKTCEGTARAADALGGETAARYEDAVSGRTGIEGFDHWAEELVRTGYLHNHARMWFASIWIFTLGLPWTLGADFFLRHLIDGDPASNTLSWRWVAGLHTRGKSYLATKENISRFTHGRFAPQGLARAAPPLSDDWNGEALPPPIGQRPARDVPALLLLHEDDLHPESMLALRDLHLTAIAALPAAPAPSPLGPAPLPLAFARGALADGLSRAGVAFGADTVQLAEAAEAVSLARETGAGQIVTPYAPLGPARSALEEVEASAGGALPLIRLLRPYDEAAWPHCAKGFFGLKKAIPRLL